MMGSGSGGTPTGINQLMELLAAKAAKDLGVDPTPKE
jgi:hypothetical protein